VCGSNIRVTKENVLLFTIIVALVCFVRTFVILNSPSSLNHPDEYMGRHVMALDTSTHPNASQINHTKAPVQVQKKYKTNDEVILEALSDAQKKEYIQFWKDNKPDRKVNTANCKELILGNETEAKIHIDYMKKHPKKPLNDELFLSLTKNCTDFKVRRNYVLHPLSKEEAEYPIAFSILLHNNIEQAERLLRSVYHPQNLYCLHVDGKASKTIHAASQALASCFDNVFIASKLERIVYAGYTRLQAELNCMTDALAANRSWHYYINLASSVYPLRTNAEMVKVLKIYNGSNDIEGVKGQAGRYKVVWKEIDDGNVHKVQKTNNSNPAPPHGLKIVKGSAYGIFSREFVDFVLHDDKAQDLLNWSRNTYSPDEHVWATLNHLQENPQLKTPGGYKGDPYTKPWMAIYAAWGRRTLDPCFSGKTRHGVCVFGLKDLPMLFHRYEFVANKFEMDGEYMALDCLEEYLYNRTVAASPFDTFHYRVLPFINRHLMWPDPKPKKVDPKKT